MLDKEQLSKEINKKIIERMEHENITLNNLAKLSNIPQSTLNSIINEQKIPNVYNLYKISKGLNVNLKTLLKGIK